MGKCKRISKSIGLIAALSFTASSFAERAEWRDWPVGDRFGIELSGMNIRSETDLKVDAEGYNGIGLFVNFEDILDVEEDTWVPAVSAYWRISERNTLRYSWFDLDRDGKAPIDIELGTIGGEPFGPVIETTFDIESNQLTWNYSFIFEKTRDFYAGIGLAYYEIDLSLVDVEGWLDPLTENLGAPVPAFTLGYDWAFDPKWVWRNQFAFLALDLNISGDDYSGNVFSLGSTVEWRVLPNISLTAGWELYKLDVSMSDGDYNWDLDFTYDAPRLGVILRL